jgi:hypothetical protein
MIALPVDRKGIRVAALVSGAAFPVVWALLPMELKEPVFNWMDGSVGKVVLVLMAVPGFLSVGVSLFYPGRPDRSEKWRAARTFFINFNLAQGFVWLTFVLYIVLNPVVPH